MDIGPTIVYNVASRTGQDVTPDIVMKLAEHHNFLGMKECAGNRRIEGYVKEGILCWSGNDDEVRAGRGAMRMRVCSACAVVYARRPSRMSGLTRPLTLFPSATTPCTKLARGASSPSRPTLSRDSSPS